jgi:hypothetical protein
MRKTFCVPYFFLFSLPPVSNNQIPYSVQRKLPFTGRKMWSSWCLRQPNILSGDRLTFQLSKFSFLNFENLADSVVANCTGKLNIGVNYFYFYVGHPLMMYDNRQSQIFL